MKSSTDLEMLPVMEYFLTLQGEGHYSGRAAVFIRLGGCDVGCVWCDVKESWDAGRHALQPVQFLADFALKSAIPFVVVTGGEPAMYDLSGLLNILHEKGVETAIETSGAYPIQGKADWICVSPKKFKAPLAENLALAHELKVVIYHPSDFKWAEENAAGVREDCHLFLQPEFSRFEQTSAQIVEYIKANPRWRMSIQTHKYLGIP